MTLARVLDVGADAGDEADLRIRKRAAVATALVLLAVSILIGVIDLARAETVAAALAVVQVIACSAALLVFRATHRIAHLFVPLAVFGLLVLWLSLIPSGGFNWAADDLAWIILVPLGAVLFLGRHAALPALGAVVLAVLAAVAIDPLIQEAAPDPSLTRTVFSAINLIVPAAIALGLVVFIDGERVRAKAASETLLLNVLPPSIADRLKQGERVIADHHDAVTVLFADLVDFTPFAARATPAAVVALLDEIFSAFDVLAEQHGLEKIKTIGDSYMVVAGLPEPRSDHAFAIVELAIAMHAAANAAAGPPGYQLRLRTGIASGPAVAGVIGHRKFSYDVWGDAVNLASRMESTGVPDMIQVADSTWSLCHEHFPFAARDVEVKGLGKVRAHLLDPRSIAAQRVHGTRVVVANTGPES
jgi:class 3 adenylate cyclase